MLVTLGPHETFGTGAKAKPVTVAQVKWLFLWAHRELS
jgi:hypothetical protein